jgi:predicted fused transcriptional regulator/phosphomethylpyrimidine kinase
LLDRISYKSAGIGKEPLFVLIGENAVEVATLSVRIAKEWKKAREEHG